MLNVFDVAKYILSKAGEMTTMKLQKLVYYSQAWHLAWYGVPLFNEDFQAWSNGPVCPELFSAHKGLFVIDKSKLQYGDDAKLKGNPKGTVDSIIDFYGDKDAHWLSMLTHKERPWLKARDGIPEGDYCINIIEKEEMQDYYSGLS
ncbi:MAG: hypothetical protein APF77_01215 [Clostridia bacterium BRH_c25]|nr:MAG: hypothetical protein APF77_01215 [Clostridia bacterium BRH_c25]